MKKLIILLSILITVSCTNESKIKILSTGEKSFVYNDKYDAGDTIIVVFRASEYEIDEMWVGVPKDTSICGSGSRYCSNYKKAVILD